MQRYQTIRLCANFTEPMTKETWKRIENTSYEVSNAGRVRAFEDAPRVKKGQFLTPYTNQNGSVMFSFQYTQISVARLVAKYFLDGDDLRLGTFEHEWQAREAIREARGKV